MEYLAGCIIGGGAIFTLAMFAIRDLKKIYKARIKELEKEVKKLKNWIEGTSLTKEGK